MVVKQPNEEDSVFHNAIKISGDPAGNRTQMTGLKDRVSNVCQCPPMSASVEIFWICTFTLFATIRSCSPSWLSLWLSWQFVLPTVLKTDRSHPWLSTGLSHHHISGSHLRLCPQLYTGILCTCCTATEISSHPLVATSGSMSPSLYRRSIVHAQHVTTRGSQTRSNSVPHTASAYRTVARASLRALWSLPCPLECRSDRAVAESFLPRSSTVHGDYFLACGRSS
jgi:hypothetical protein